MLAVLDGAARLATPLILCAMAGLVSERSGIVDIGLEGKLLAGAFAAAAAAALTGSPWAGLAAALAASTMLALVHGFACIGHRGEQIVSGVAVNILALGMTAVAANALFRHGGHTPALGAGRALRPRHPAVCGNAARRAAAGAALCRAAVRPQPAGLCRVPVRRAGLVAALAHPVRAQAARRRRTAGGGGQRRRFGVRAALPRRPHCRPALRAGGGLPLHRPRRRLRARDERRQGLPRACGADLRALAAAAGALRLPAVRPAGHGRAAGSRGWSCRWSARRRSRWSRCCPMR